MIRDEWCRWWVAESTPTAPHLIENLELQPSKNTTQADYLNYSISNQDLGGIGQAKLSISLLNFPLEQVQLENGDQVTRGKEYLL